MRPVTASLLSCLAAGALLSQAAAAESNNADLAQKVQAILEVNCGACHGPNGKGDGHDAFDTVIDLKKLVENDKHYVVPNKPDESKLLIKIKSGKMPPKRDLNDKPLTQRPSAADVALLVQWIEAGAPAGGDGDDAREFITSESILDLMNKDLSKMKRPIDRQNTRYFTLTHLYNAGVRKADLDLYRGGLSKLVNSLSRENPDVVVPVAIDPAHTVYRVDLRKYGWTDQTWNSVVGAYPYGVLPDSDAARAVSAATNSAMPYVRADWFVFTASKPPLYESILQIPDTVDVLEDQLGVHRLADVENNEVARAGFNKSGVSNNNRVIERHKFRNGAYWRSGDFANSKDDNKNLFEHPLDFIPDGGEIIFNLPNGLQAYMLVDKDGKRIENGPIKIVHDDTQPDKVVVNGISCMTCHDRGMKEKTDEIRKHVKETPDFNADEKDKVDALYPEAEEFAKLLEKDEKRFQEAAKEAGALFGDVEPVKALAKRFETEMDLKLAASELGLTVEDFQQSLKAKPELGLGKVFGILNVPGGTVKREVFEARFPDLADAAGLGQLFGTNFTGTGGRQLQQAKDLEGKGDVAGARKVYDTLLSRNPNNLEALQGRGDMLFKQGSYADAIADYEKATALNPDDVASIGLRGISHFNLGETDKAVEDLDLAISKNTTNPFIFETRGDIHLGKNEFTEAIDSYGKAADMPGASATAKGKLANALSQRGLDHLNNDRTTEAIDDLKRASELSPDSEDIAFNLGLAHRKNGDEDEAVKDFTKVIDLDSMAAGAFEQRAIVEAAQGKYTDSIDDLLKAIDLVSANAVLHDELAQVYTLNADYDQAIDSASKAIDLDPNSAHAYRVRADAYAKRNADGDADRAQADLDKAADLEK